MKGFVKLEDDYIAIVEITKKLKDGWWGYDPTYVIYDGIEGVILDVYHMNTKERKTDQIGTLIKDFEYHLTEEGCYWYKFQLKEDHHGVYYEYDFYRGYPNLYRLYNHGKIEEEITYYFYSKHTEKRYQGDNIKVINYCLGGENVIYRIRNYKNQHNLVKIDEEIYRSNGKLWKATYYKDGMKVMKKMYYENGYLKYIHNYNRFHRDGKQHGYFENGSVNYILQYSNGSKNGIQLVFYDNNQCSLEFNYVNDKKVGVQKKWDKNGVLTTSEYDENGLNVKFKNRS